MKHLFCTLAAIVLIGTVGMSQTKPFNYAEQWKKVEKQRNSGLPKEAIKLVDEIYQHAKAEQQHGHFLRAIIYQIGLVSTYEESSVEKAILRLDEEIKTSSEPQIQILHSTKADVLWNYYQNNRYQFMNRSATTKYVKEDLATWDLRSIVAEVFQEFSLSLKNEKLLKQTNLKQYNQILNEGDDDRYRATLYDFLVHRAIDFYMGEEPQILKPANTFYINNPKYLAPSNEFITLHLSTQDSLSMKFFALKLLQQAVQFHLHDTNPAALIDVELKRLEFVKNNGTFDNKDSLYLASLIKLYTKYQAYPDFTNICYMIARQYQETAEKYDSLTNPKVQFNYIKALEYCDIAIKRYPNTNGANNCKYYKHIITSPELTLNTETNLISDLPSRVMVNFKNTKKIYVRIIPISREEYFGLTSKYWGDELMKKILAMRVINQYEEVLPANTDYQKRTAELKVPALKKGEYIILTSANETFDYGHNPLSYAMVCVTDLSYIERTLPSGSTEIAVTNRKTGEPVANAVVDVRFSTYNYTYRKYEMVNLIKGNTDLDGHFVIPPVKSSENSRSIEFTIKYKGDVCYSKNSIYQYYIDTIARTTVQTYFFTDRAIYRPGQTIYFKGITVEYKGKTSKILTGRATHVRLLDVNWQEKGSLDLITNDFGSFQGTFIAPTGGLTGQMQLNTENSSVSFRVEEYKRPKFETTFNPVKGSYRLNDKVTVTGNAKAYAGNAIDGATVKYRVTRQASYPWWRWWWGYQPASSSMEILNGETTTNDKGEYTIVFDAIPDLNAKEEFMPIFNYVISVDVSDINGETHATSTNVCVGYISMYAKIGLPSEIDQADIVRNYDVRTTNLNGQLDPATIQIKAYRLEQPSAMYNLRFWPKPTSFIYSKEEYSKLFPNELYNDELNKNTWKKLEVAYDKSHNTISDTILTFENLKTWKTGDYIIEVKGKDNFGVPFEKSQFFSV